MAGEWIKVELVTPDKPEIHQMAAFLGMTPEEVLGCLIRVWSWADQQSLDGHALRVTDSTINSISRRDRFATAMRDAGWLKGESGVLTLPNFDRHNGETSKKRALATKRKQNQRSRERHAAGGTKTGPEKRREEGKTYGGVSLGDNPSTSTPTSPQETPRRVNGYSQAAYDVLAFLNEKTGKHFRPVDANLKLIDARLASGVSIADVRAVVARKVREWGGRPDMEQYLRPETLFGQTKFEQYLGEVPQNTLLEGS